MLRQWRYFIMAIINDNGFATMTGCITMTSLETAMVSSTASSNQPFTIMDCDSKYRLGLGSLPKRAGNKVADKVAQILARTFLHPSITWRKVHTDNETYQKLPSIIFGRFKTKSSTQYQPNHFAPQALLSCLSRLLSRLASIRSSEF